MNQELFSKAREYYESNRCWEFGWHQFSAWCESEGIDPDEWFDEYRIVIAAEGNSFS